MRLILTVISCGLLLWPTAVLGQEEDWEAMVQSDLEKVRDEMVAPGGSLNQVGESFIGVLGEDESAVGEVEDLEVEEQGIVGADYVLIAVCDPDCLDIDLYLYDQDGNEVDTDIEAGKPAKIVTDRLESGYTIEVYMAECAVAPCYYGLALFKGTAAGQQTE